MAGSSFTIDVSELEALSKRMIQIASMDFSRLLHEIGVTEEGEIKERFEDKRDPDGKPWERWSRGYSSRQAERNPSASILMGPQARVHQKGGMAGRNQKVRIPARPYLGIGESNAELLAETVGDFLTRESGGLL